MTSHPRDPAAETSGTRPARPVRYVLGVDTGGTCTDAVLLDAATRRVTASAKRPTTHHDLGRGMAEAMAAVLAASGMPAAAVDLVSVSTTLATNAVVEHQGAEVGLFVIGYAGRIAVPCAVMDVIPGGHKLDGSEEAPLALDRLVDSIRLMRDRVDAYAVCGMMSFVNPTHELVAERAIAMADPKPVFCSHLASQRAGMKERAATAVLNARLLPVMRRFLDGMAVALDGLGVTAPVLVVRGDATVMPMAEALRAASATVASGPAAMAGYGAAHDRARHGAVSEADPGASPRDTLIVDVGGTTTDVTLLRRGLPVVQTGGMVVGDWETHVDAVEMFTVGVGGDSLVRPEADGGLSVGPHRVTPLCMSGPLPDPARWLRPGGGTRCICPVRRADACGGANGTGNAEDHAVAKDAAERAVLGHLHAHGPTPADDLPRALRLPESTLERTIDRLVRRRAVQVAGFTPTDALHVLGLLELSSLPGLSPEAGNAAAALAGARALAALLPPAAGGGNPPETAGTPQEAARAVLAAAGQRIEDAVVQHVARREVGGNFAAYLAQRRRHGLLRVNVALGAPMVGIGAASRHLLPAVARALSTTVTFPDRYDVGNALGAALLALDKGDAGAGERRGTDTAGRHCPVPRCPAPAKPGS